MNDATLILFLAGLLQVISLGIAGWTLGEVITIGKKISAHEQQLKDLPCSDCEPNRR